MIGAIAVGVLLQPARIFTGSALAAPAAAIMPVAAIATRAVFHTRMFSSPCALQPGSVLHVRQEFFGIELAHFRLLVQEAQLDKRARPRILGRKNIALRHLGILK